MIDFVIRHCGYAMYLPLIVEVDTGRELYRGSHHQTPEDALQKALQIWEEDGTGNIVEFKQEKGL